MKYQVLNITNKCKPVRHSFEIHGHTLVNADSVKYLGVHLHNSLEYPDQQISQQGKLNICLHPTKSPPKSRNIKELAYKSLVRPTLEYAATEWNPTHKATFTKLKWYDVELLALLNDNMNAKQVYPAYYNNFNGPPLKGTHESYNAP